jgi:magnesium chelatase family protein
MQYDGDSGVLHTYRVAGLEAPSTHHAVFRAPHHTVSEAAMRGWVFNGWAWRPGEMSLASGGVLFLDEITEFRKPVLEAVLEAMTTGEAGLAGHPYPAKFRLIAAMNPCPCGQSVPRRHGGSAQRECKCTGEQVARHWRRVPPKLMELLRAVEVKPRRLVKGQAAGII